MALEGINAHPDDVVVTVGSQQAVDLVTRIFCDPGDVVICEAPSYVGALGVFKAFQCQVVHAEMDADGSSPTRCGRRSRSPGPPARRSSSHTIPNFHNPAGVTMSLARRAEILDICRSEGVLVLEDNPYGLLGFDSEPMRRCAPTRRRASSTSGRSRRPSPGMRVGWALAPHAVREKLVLAQESATLCPPAFNQMAVSRTSPARLAGPDQADAGDVPRAARRDDRGAPGLHAGRLPVERAARRLLRLDDALPGIDAKAMLPRAVTARVAYVPGTAFFADGFGSGSMRLSFCYPHPERIREGAPPGRRPRGGDGAARDVRRHPCPPPAPQRVRRPRNGPL